MKTMFQTGTEGLVRTFQEKKAQEMIQKWRERERKAADKIWEVAVPPPATATATTHQKTSARAAQTTQDNPKKKKRKRQNAGGPEKKLKKGKKESKKKSKKSIKAGKTEDGELCRRIALHSK